MTVMFDVKLLLQYQLFLKCKLSPEQCWVSVEGYTCKDWVSLRIKARTLPKTWAASVLPTKRYSRWDLNQTFNYIKPFQYDFLFRGVPFPTVITFDWSTDAPADQHYDSPAILACDSTSLDHVGFSALIKNKDVSRTRWLWAKPALTSRNLH